MEYIFGAYLSLQLLKCFTIFEIQLPALVVIVLDNLRSLVDFEMLSPKNLLKKFLTPEQIEWLEGAPENLNQNLINSGITSSSPLKNM